MRIVGIDPSLVRTAVVVLPSGWPWKWSEVDSELFGHSLPRGCSEVDRIQRCRSIAAGVVAWCLDRGATHAWIESYAYSRADQAHSLGELGGILRDRLIGAFIRIESAPISSARKLLLGKCPRTGAEAKTQVAAAVRAAGGPPWSLDESDAFAVANWGTSQMGLVALAQVAR